MTMLLGVSLKTYMTPAETEKYIKSLRLVFDASQANGIDFFIIPDVVSLAVVRRSILPQHVLLGAQDCFWEDNGAYTGTISPKNLSLLGVQLVELGHAEQRRFFNETDEQVSLKAIAAVRNGLTPLICVGEQVCDEKTAITTCVKQLKAVTDSIPEQADLIVAYEPVWAIGKSSPAEPNYIANVAQGIRKEVQNRKGKTRIIYGGSAGPCLFEKLHPAVDGLFLGRFGHNPSSVLAVIEELALAMAKASEAKD